MTAANAPIRKLLWRQQRGAPFPLACLPPSRASFFLAPYIFHAPPTQAKKLFRFLQCFLDCRCSYGSDVTKMSLEALSSLATHCFLEIQKNVKVPTHEILQHFLKVRNLSLCRCGRSLVLHSASSRKQFLWVTCGYLLSKLLSWALFLKWVSSMSCKLIFTCSC